MKKTFLILATVFGLIHLAPAAVVTFTGGTVYKSDGSTATTDTDQGFWSVDYYTESGFKFDYLGIS